MASMTSTTNLPLVPVHKLSYTSWICNSCLSQSFATYVHLATAPSSCTYLRFFFPFSYLTAS